MVQEEFCCPTFNLPEKGVHSWQAPSNIALIKYWGKYGLQLPKNASLSFTLSACQTQTKVIYTKQKQADKFSFKVFLEGEHAPSFEPKIATFLDRIEAYLPFLRNYHFDIYTQNTFPHSSGIASSASGLAALACCLLSIEKEHNPELTEEKFAKKASFLARLGSGSAARSITGPLMLWGEHQGTEKSSQLFAIPYEEPIDTIFRDFQDTILLVDRGKKEVSSTLGHNLMLNHPYAENRFQQAQHQLSQLKKVLKEGDLKNFTKIVEMEALALHAMMMTSDPYFILMKPNTLEIIQRIWAYREANDSGVCFTLDAGANVHLLYPKKEKKKILDFVKNQLVAFCEKGQYICDEVGLGASVIES